MNNEHLDSPLVMDRPRKQYDPMGHPIAPPDNETLRKIGTDNQELLAACAIHDIIQLERNSKPGPGPGTLERKLADPAAFKKEIKDSYAFSSAADASRIGKNAIQSVLMGQQVADLAYQYIARYNDKIRAQNESKARPNQNGDRVDPQPQKSEGAKEPVNVPKAGGPIV